MTAAHSAEPRDTVVDLRSDTVTRPTPAMRAAMAAAEVGDDVYHEDPTVNRLESRAAAIFGKQAALFVPTGTMGNQIAIRLHTQPGQEVLCEARSHIVEWEMATLAAFSGCMARGIQGERGIVTWAELKNAIAPAVYYHAQTGMISLENTHNLAGGTVMPLGVVEEIWAGAKEAGLPSHLDGARIFNAAAALNLSVAQLTHGFDTVMFCLSKGLCAPVGSMLVGSLPLMERARSIRKALGGGMRQAGVLAAAGLIALEEMPQRLHEDHANARLMAEMLKSSPGAEVDLATVETNIVFFQLRGQKMVGELVAKAKSRGVLVHGFGAHHVRVVTHHDASAEGCQRAATILIEEIAAM